MACNCNTNNDCNSTVDCSCGIKLDVYQNGLLVDSVVFTGHGPSTPYTNFYFFDDIAISPSLEVPTTIMYNQTSQMWEFKSGFKLIGALKNNGSCPISSCDWESECLSLLISDAEGAYSEVFNWTGNTENGYNTYMFNSNITGRLVPYTIYFNLTTGKWTMRDMMTFTDVAHINTLNLSCPIGEWIDILSSDSFGLFTQNNGVSGYTFQTYAAECGCCDEQIEVTMTTQTIDGITQQVYTAEIVKDEFGNTLALNGKPYYFFDIDGEMYFVLFDGTSWVIQTDCDDSYRITEEDEYRRTQYNNLRKLD